MTSEERDRIVAWLVAEFEVQNGIDVSRDVMAIDRLREVAERTASAIDKYEVNLPFLAADATGPKHFHVVLTTARIAAIREGREGPPHVDRARRSSPPPPPETPLERAERDPPRSSPFILVIVLIVVLAGVAIAIVSSGHSHHDEDGHGQEHKR